MEALINLCKKVKALDEDKMMSEIFNQRAIKDEAIRLNKEVQLFQRGENTLGRKMRSIYARFGNYYADLTMAIKREKQQATDRVTLNDTGAFYRSFRAVANKEGLDLEANTIKDGQDLEGTWGQVVGLNENSREVLIEKAKKEVLKYVSNKVLQ